MDIKGMGAMMQAMGILLPIIDQKHRQDLVAAWNISTATVASATV
jgi:hypothetical protein